MFDKLIVKRYCKEDKNLWDDFLESSKNSTFLFKRSYMDYHSDRFVDYSLLIYDKDKLLGLLPANLHNANTVISHGGLTYGGLVVKKSCSSKSVLLCYYKILEYLHTTQINKLLYKHIPTFYNTIGSCEIEYGLFLTKALLYRVDVASVICCQDKMKYSEIRERGIKKAIKNNIFFINDNRFDLFWIEILAPNLNRKFGVNPVHTLEEILHLKKENPLNIHQYNAYLDNKIIAGCTIYETPTVAHAQYISANDLGKENGGLDILFHKLISEVYKDKNYFSFGTVNESNGNINLGLLQWKESFGARSFAHKFYEIETCNYYLLENTLFDG